MVVMATARLDRRRACVLQASESVQVQAVLPELAVEAFRQGILARLAGLNEVQLVTFTRVYNDRGPHQALGGVYPGDVYTPSARVYQPPDEPDYPCHDRAVRVTRCGRLCLGRRKLNLSTAFAGQMVGVREVEDQIWQVSFLEYDLGGFDHEKGRVEPGPDPFVPDKVLTMCPE